MKLPITLAFAAAASLATPAIAQSDDAPFNGAYIGVSVGGSFQSSDSGSSVLFDRNLDGVFGDTVTTAAGANAFSPGFCSGAALTNAAPGGCRGDKDGVDYNVRAGFDKQIGSFVIGGLVEFGKSEIRDSVTAFSVTPASYILTRKVKFGGRVAARAGYALGKTLVYGTGGFSFARINNSFATTNVVNRFTPNGDSGAAGFNLGGGIQRKITRRIAVGVEYLYTDLTDDNFRLRVGPAAATPATNAFILGNPAGTDFARSDDHFRYQSVRAVVTFGF